MWLLGATVLAACLPMVLSSPSCVLFCDTQANASSCIRGCQLGNTSLSACTLCRDVDCTNGCHQAFYCRSCTTLCSLIGGEFSCVNPAADTTGERPSSCQCSINRVQSRSGSYHYHCRRVLSARSTDGGLDSVRLQQGAPEEANRTTNAKGADAP